MNRSASNRGYIRKLLGLGAVFGIIFAAQAVPASAADRKKIVMITTGGAIAQRYSYSKRDKVDALSPEEMLKSIPELRGMTDVDVTVFSDIEAGSMTPPKMFELAMAAWKALKDQDVNGVIIVHGTETLEETAFMLDLLIDSEKPVVITGADRPASDPSPDGPGNLLNAFRAALDEESKNRGTLVVLNDSIYSAKEAGKTSSSDADSFRSPYGPVGKIISGKVLYIRPRQKRFIIAASDASKKVQFIKMVAGMDSLLFRVAMEGGSDGVVIEGFGSGSLNEENFLAVRSAVEKKIPLVMASRCGSGFVSPDQDGQYSGKKLADQGVVFSGDLTGLKARILLILVLNRTSDPKEIQSYFDKFYAR